MTLKLILNSTSIKRTILPSLVSLLFSLVFAVIAQVSELSEWSFIKLAILFSIAIFGFNTTLFYTFSLFQKQGKKPERVLFASMGLYPLFMIILFMIGYTLQSTAPTRLLLVIMLLYVIYKSAFVIGVQRIK